MDRDVIISVVAHVLFAIAFIVKGAVNLNTYFTNAYYDEKFDLVELIFGLLFICVGFANMVNLGVK